MEQATGQVWSPTGLLFIIFINDLRNISNDCRFHFYADYTTISISGYRTTDVENNITHHAYLVAEWMKLNQLTLNTEKTVITTFRTAATLKKLGDLTIQVDGNNLEVVDNTKCLGVILPYPQFYNT